MLGSSAIGTFLRTGDRTLVLTELGRIVILQGLPQVPSFAALDERASEVEIDDLIVKVCSSEDLLAMKRAGDRPRDRDDLEALEAGRGRPLAADLTKLVKLPTIKSMEKAVSIGEAKANFSELVRRAEEGEEIVLRRGAHRVARIVPLAEKGRVSGFGSMKGEIRIGRDFNQQLEDFAEYE
jgi:prevent-host-death family protein